MSQTDEIRMTLVHTEIEDGDTFYPEVEKGDWRASYIEPREDFTLIDYTRPVLKTQGDSDDGE
jgi:dihydrofolate reductase